MFLIDAIGWPLGQSFLSPQTILPMFIARLTQSNVLIGMVGGIQSLGQLLPQLLAASRIERLPLKKRYVVWVGILFERLPILVLVAAVFWLSDPVALLIVFFLCWAIINLATGFNLPAFMGMYAKGVPTEKRGRITGTGNFGGTLLAAGGAYAARFMLEAGSGFRGYGWVFLTGFLVLLVSLFSLIFVDESPDDTSGARKSVRRYLEEIPAILRNKPSFASYIVMQIALQVAFACTAFITGYAVRILGATEGTVAIFTALLMVSTAAGSLPQWCSTS